MASNSATKVKFLVRAIYDYDTGNVAILVSDLGSPGHSAAIIDPLESRVEFYEQLMKEFGDLKLTHILQTHVPCDNTKSGALLLKKHFPEAKTVISKASGAQADILVQGGDKIEVGGLVLEVKATPGHTKGCVSYVTVENPQVPTPFAFTGHSLLIRGSGRTDLEGGDAEELYQSVHSQVSTACKEIRLTGWDDCNLLVISFLRLLTRVFKFLTAFAVQLFTLPARTHILPGFDYNRAGHTLSTMREEKAHNPYFMKK